uniref:Uncharacterized protein n=1 Tax=Setaria italica TaxID=4555 RepID=K4AH88_SETIT
MVSMETFSNFCHEGSIWFPWKRFLQVASKLDFNTSLVLIWPIGIMEKIMPHLFTNKLCTFICYKLVYRLDCICTFFSLLYSSKFTVLGQK